MMTSFLKRDFVVFLMAVFPILTACGDASYKMATDQTLPSAILDEPYVYQLESVDQSGSATTSDAFVLDTGALPDGLILGASGEISGTPEAVGMYQFGVMIAEFGDTEDYWDNYADATCWIDDSCDAFDDDGDFAAPTTDLLLVVTEPSTNADCPEPDDIETGGIYLCLGEVGSDAVASDGRIALDLTYFVDWNRVEDYDVDFISFTVRYDASLFAPSMSGMRAREASYSYWSTWAVDDATEGKLVVTLDLRESAKAFRHSGRMMTLSFEVLGDVSAGAEFTLEGAAVTSSKSTETLPEPTLISGRFLADS